MKQNIKYIKSILKRYAQLKANLSNFAQVSSVPMDNVNVQGSKRNGVEDSLVGHCDLVMQVKQVEDALKAVADPQYSFILNDYVINKQHTRDEMCGLLDVSRSKLNYMKNNALVEFGKNFAA